MNTRVFIGLGSNLDAPGRHVLSAFDELARLPLTRLVARSALYRSAPVGYPHQPDFINAVAQVATALDPHALLTALLALERRHGRRRDFANGPRTLDLDVLLYGDLVLAADDLTLPHPRIGERAFVLQPLVEIAPDCVIPGLGRADAQLGRCRGQRLERLDEEACHVAG